MTHLLLHLANWLLWAVMAASVLYVAVFALASLLPRKQRVTPNRPDAPLPRFLVLMPAYHEDAVIGNSVAAFLRQDYPEERYTLAVVSDHMLPATNQRLSSLPITLLTPTFEKSSKARALQYAVNHAGTDFDFVVVLDADNVVAPCFLRQLSALCLAGHQAIQCHRTAKNTDNAVATLDGLSEEINNAIFRRGHNRLGLSSALIGSGMCFSYAWFSSHVPQLNSAVEDRELEALLMREGIHIHYADDILVQDEKVSSQDNFQRQRLRWMTGQVQTLLLMLPHLPWAVAHGRLNYIDKTLQQALIPRSLLLATLTLVSLAATALVLIMPGHSWCVPLRWWGLLAVLCAALFVAIPPQLRTRAAASSLLAFPRLAWRLVQNLGKIRTSNKDFIHTQHSK